MAFKFPFTNYHELNLTWVLEQLKKLFEDSEENVETIESYENRLSAVETELPTVEATANQAESVANAAASLAQTAKNTADTANENALTASAHAGLARQEAAAAEAEAQAATQAAQQAQATVQDFDGRITQAEDDASEALQEAQSFENRVNAAINTANNAANTATIAQGIAVNANQNAATALDTAQTADGKAEAAQDAADIADGKAEAAQDTADQNAANIGNLANLTTTAKNNLVAAINEAAQSGGSGYNTNCAPIIINTASGDVATFDDGANNRQIRKIVGTIVPIQSGTGDPAPDNVRPISGWTEGIIYNSGNDFYKTDGTTAFSDVSKVTILGNDSIKVERNGNTSYPSSKQAMTTYNLVDGHLYRVSAYATIATGSAMISIRRSTAATVKSSETITTNGNLSLIFAYDSSIMDILSFFAGWNEARGNVTYTNIRFEDVTALPINWQTEAGTIYGGTVTLNEDGSVDVVKTHVKLALNTVSETANWIAYANANGYYLKSSVSNMLAGTWYSDPLTMCDSYPKINSYNYFGVRFGNLNGNIFFCNVNTDYPTVSDWCAYIASSNVNIVYPIDQEVYHFPNVGQLYTYLGTNNVWIDTGAITECDYPADTKLYIDGKIAELQALVLEN